MVTSNNLGASLYCVCTSYWWRCNGGENTLVYIILVYIILLYIMFVYIILVQHLQYTHIRCSSPHIAATPCLSSNHAPCCPPTQPCQRLCPYTVQYSNHCHSSMTLYGGLSNSCWGVHRMCCQQVLPTTCTPTKNIPYIKVTIVSCSHHLFVLPVDAQVQMMHWLSCREPCVGWLGFFEVVLGAMTPQDVVDYWVG